jgi:MtaA/CmuA family methyltransferase
MTGRERILCLLNGGRADRAPLMPITMMFAARQAGVAYGKYATDAAVLAAAQAGLAERFETDHVSAISDPAREVADLGGAVRYFDDQPPAVDEERSLLAEKEALATLRPPGGGVGARMNDRVRGIERLRKHVGDAKLVEGWVEGPCALAADFRGINRLMLDFYDDEAFVGALFDFCIDMEIEFARQQVQAGADLIGVGDAAASLVGPEIYEQFVWPAEKRLVDAIAETGARVRLHICGNTRPILGGMGRLGCDIVDLDYLAPLDEARAAMGEKQVLLGNIEPVGVLRNGTPASIRAALAECQKAAGPRWIVSAGCEVPRDTPLENFEALCRFATEA